MSTSADRERMLSEMTRAEKAELLQWIVRDLVDNFPGIESKPDVMGGVPLHYAHSNPGLAAGTGSVSRH